MSDKVQIELKGRVIYARMSGLLNEAEMQDAYARMNATTDRMGGKRHIVVADMRGFKALHPAIAARMGEAIAYGRRNGCVLCIHLSDDSVQRLQAARLARQNALYDDMTIDVDSREEADRLAAQYAKFVDDPKFTASIRSALPD